MQRSLFFKLMAMFTAVILLCVLLLLSVFVVTSRNAQINNRMQALKSQAYDIAYLAGTQTLSSINNIFAPGKDTAKLLLERKVKAVYDEYGAYCLVVDRSGRVTSYFSSVLKEHQELDSQLDFKSMLDTLYRVVAGEEIITQTQGDKGPMFTVAVPWSQDGVVVGAVYIQTAAQTVQAAYAGLWTQAAIAATLSFLAAAGIAFFYTRRLVKPLQEMTVNARLMEKGQAVNEVSNSDVTELNELSASFNHMAKIIQDTEQTRRAFIANLSHELRSPMTSIQGFIQGLLDGTVKAEESRQTLQIVLNETKRMNHLVSGLLNLSRAEANEQGLVKEPFNLCEVARLVLITKLSQIEDKGISIQTDFEKEDLFALAARDQVEQIFINLIDNAIRFTPSGGKIIISIKEQEKGLLAVTVSDNGIGILQEDREKIFDRFFKSDQAHTSGDGVGLGLSIVKTILERHHQTIRLLPGEEGASFEFTLEKAEKNNGKHHASESLRED